MIELSAVCIRLATLPRIGAIKHGYETPSAGFAFGQNWIFFDCDDDEMNFIHILHSRRDKSAIRF